MQLSSESFLQYFDNPVIQTGAGLIALVLTAWVTGVLSKRLLRKMIRRSIRSKAFNELEISGRLKFVPWLASILPAIILAEGVRFLTNLPDGVSIFISNLAQAFVVIVLTAVAIQVINILNYMYERRPDANDKPIKGYMQILKIVIYIIATVLVLALLVNRSPLILISGLGAAAAVFMFVFQNTLLSLVASVQISAGQLIRIGDWVEMRQQNADGFVIDMALHTVRIQNWDKTITTVPTKNFISESFINWRGMQESGGRRIKRSILIDQHSIRFLTQEELEKLKGLELLEPYLTEKLTDIESWNTRLQKKEKSPLNNRSLTNIGTFRAYALEYIKSNPLIRKDMLFLTRLLEPTPEGVPLEIYCFTDTVAWVSYEAIQSDMFDHFLSIINEFGLNVFQNPTGEDFRYLAQAPTRTV